MVTIREAKPGDYLALTRLSEDVVSENSWLTPEPGDTRFTCGYWSSGSERGDLILVALVGDAVVGFLRLQHGGDGNAHTLAMLVDKAHRGRGIGKALVTEVVTRLERQPRSAIVLSVYAHNEAAIALYSKSGFRKVAFFRSHCKRRNGEIWSAWTMRRDIHGSTSRSR